MRRCAVLRVLHMTRRQRIEARAEKREEWAEGRAAKSAAAFAASDMREERSGIPFGQPILVGHHSERHHRRAIERADAAMRRSVEHHNMAKHHASTAANLRSALDRSIFSDDPDAIEALEAKAAKLDAKAERANALNKDWRRLLKKAGGDIAKAAAAFAELHKLTDATRDEMARQAGQYSWIARSGPMDAKHDRAEARRCRQRIEDIRRRQAATQKAEAAGGMTIARSGGWCSVTFAEKPERNILDALRSAGFRWGAGRWSGREEALPACVLAMEGEREPESVPSRFEVGDLVRITLDNAARMRVASIDPDFIASAREGGVVVEVKPNPGLPSPSIVVELLRPVTYSDGTRTTQTTQFNDTIEAVEVSVQFRDASEVQR